MRRISIEKIQKLLAKNKMSESQCGGPQRVDHEVVHL